MAEESELLISCLSARRAESCWLSWERTGNCEGRLGNHCWLSSNENVSILKAQAQQQYVGINGHRDVDHAES